MKATTVKIEGELLKELERAKPDGQSLAAFIRSILLRELQRRQMHAAAQRYTDFLGQQAEERAWLEEWDRADLVAPPRRTRR